MEKKKSDKIKTIVIILVFILIIIALLVFFILFTHQKDDGITVNNTVQNNIIDNSTNENNLNNSNNQNNNNSNSTEDEDKNDTKKLNSVTDMSSYFWLKDVLEKYYSSNELEDPTVMLDKDVIKELGITADNYRKFNDFDGPMFRIDEMYKQILDDNKEIYVVKHKVGKSNSDVKNSIVWIEKDENNSTFSIYPNEYLKEKNYLDFKEGDTLPVNFSKNISPNTENKFEEEDSHSAEDCMKGLFERYKFDLMADEEHLYNLLDEDYKNLKYPDINNLKQYISNNRTDLYLDSLSEYKVINYNTYIEYRAICKSGRNFVFHVRNMMDYSILLDNYNIVNKDTYNAFLPAARAKYCINRVVEALNYKDYDFIYSKLNPVQKNNYYKNINDFKEFLEKNSYEANNYEIDDDYLIISDGSVYQFKVKITDATGEDFSYITFTMAVTLKDDTDFAVSITNGK